MDLQPLSIPTLLLLLEDMQVREFCSREKILNVFADVIVHRELSCALGITAPSLKTDNHRVQKVAEGNVC